MKNLKKLQADGLLKSKSYGLGKEILWSFTSRKIVKDLGYTPPKADIHSYLYEHEKDLADVFVSLALTDTLYDWQGEGDQKIGLRPDRTFSLGGSTFYLERERGTQGKEKLHGKLTRYVSHYRQTKEPFNVLILADDLTLYLGIFEEMKLGNAYMCALQSEFVSSPLDTIIYTRLSETRLIPNTDTSSNPTP